MKKCTYCGKEYFDEALVCAIDQQPLESDASTPSYNKAQLSLSPVVRLVAASFVCLLILAIAIPNLGEIVRPNTKIKEGSQIVYGWHDALCVAIILAPLILILIGVARSRIIECVGWVLLLIVVVLMFSS
jgi:hypothetical protein